MSANAPIISLLGHVFLEQLKRQGFAAGNLNTIWQFFIAVRINDERIDRRRAGGCDRGGL